ncbi:MAG TPA: hypothetical protein VFW13_16365 [Phenylobacterium sp.]|nr:hypothetical protein [Phenylobacterium sp.]
MPKPIVTRAPSSSTRLIAVGGAKARTNAGGGFKVEELDPEIKYNPA